MKEWLQRSRVPAILLCIFVAVLFALTWVPGVIRVNTMVGVYQKNYYNSALMGNNTFNVMSGLLLGFALIPLISFARKPNDKSITVAAVILETAALLGIPEFIYTRITPPGVYTPLGYAIEAGAVLAAILAFVICRSRDLDRGAEQSSRKKLALFCLMIAAVFAVTFVKRCWRWDFTDHFSYTNYYEAGFALGCFFSVLLTAEALNVALLHTVGLVRARPIGCAILLLGAGALSALGIILHFVHPDTLYRNCVPLPLTYLIAALQLLLGIYLLLSPQQKRKKTTSPDIPNPIIS